MRARARARPKRVRVRARVYERAIKPRRRCYGRPADGTLVRLFVTLDCAQHRLIAVGCLSGIWRVHLTARTFYV